MGYDLIAAIDPKLANVWLNRPFNRHAVAIAFRAGLDKSFYAPIADKIVVNLLSIADRDRDSRKTEVA